jgi:hypothetical protein
VSTAETTASEDARALLQSRVAMFALAVGGFNTIAVAIRASLFYLWAAGVGVFPAITLGYQALASAALLGVWALTRNGRRSERFVRVVETVGLFAACAGFVMTALTLTNRVVASEILHAQGLEPDEALVLVLATAAPLMVGSFVLTYVLILRAAFVPTAAHHTAILTALVGTPLLLVGYQTGVGLGRIELGLGGPALVTASAGIQWAATVAACTAISRIIYGLRAEVREARRLGQYTLEQVIGVGGMGRVYRASHAMLRRPTAIKLLAPSRAGADALERFEREVQLTAQLKHPNVVTIYDYGRTADGVLYYAMELLDGATLEEVVEADGPQPPARVARVLDQVAGALGEAHSIGLIHRDVKPANIVLCRQGGELDVAKVVDFGLVKDMSQAGRAVAVSQDDTISGTPLYMAPEILKDPHAASPLSDLYALGAVGYYLLTGEHVFTGQTVIEVLGHHLHTQPIPPSQRSGDAIPEALERVILECLEKDPAKRPQSAGELRQKLEALDPSLRWTQRSAEKWWAAHAAVLEARRSVPHREKEGAAIEVDLVRRSISAASRKEPTAK